MQISYRYEMFLSEQKCFCEKIFSLLENWLKDDNKTAPVDVSVEAYIYEPYLRYK